MAIEESGATVRKIILIILDIEGPQLLNDDAQELMIFLAKMFDGWDKILSYIVIEPLDETEEGMTTGEIIGARFFKRISSIDDIWGDFHRIPKDPSYSSGHTLKVILAFLKALGATYQSLYDFSRGSLRLVPNVKDVVARLREKYNVWMVSTSYEFFIRAYCDLIGFPFENVYCTSVNQAEFDDIVIKQDEVTKLLEFMKEVAAMPIIDYDKKTGEVIPEYQVYYDRITTFIWDYVYSIAAGELLRQVCPVGQIQKKEAAEKILRKVPISLIDVMVVGDSQTDRQIAKLVKGTGLVMMFNAKGEVCKESDIMYIGEDARAIEEVADVFVKQGREGVIGRYTPSREAKFGGLLAAVIPKNIKKLERMSVAKRKEFRGVSIGELT